MATFLAVGVTSIIITLFLTATMPVCSIFTDDVNAIAYAGLQMRFLLPLYFIFTLNEIIKGTVLSSGHTMPPMLITLLGMCAAQRSFIYAGFSFVNNIRVIYMAFPFSWIVALQIYYHRGHWLYDMCLSEAIKQAAG